MPRSSEDRAELLGRVPVFAELGADDLGRVAQVAVRRAFEPQQVIFREGDDSDTCYIVRSGHARATRQHADGRTITLANFGPGDIFGELAMFDDERRSATVQAIDDLVTVAIPGSAMRGLLGRHPARGGGPAPPGPARPGARGGGGRPAPPPRPPPSS